MPKAILEFNLPEEREEYGATMQAGNLAYALSEIRQKMLRPARKHGFSDAYLNEVNEKFPELFGKLEEMFNEICEEVIEYT